MNAGIVVFPGTNCDKDTYWVCSNIFNFNTRYLWHTETDIKDLDLIIIPGGFSYGDYLRSGAIAKISPIMKEIINFANRGGFVLGICNGFQILAEVNLIKGAFLRNKNLNFICKQQYLKVINNKTIFTSKYKTNEIIKIPIAHGEGNFYLNDDELKYVLDNDLIAFKYCNEKGEITEETNPNGSTYNIAGIFNKNKNVLGMMPHPERASEIEMGSTDGRLIFESILNRIL